MVKLADYKSFLTSETSEIRDDLFESNIRHFQGEVDVNKKIKSTLLKQMISRDLSKPMRRYDSELDYIPTQFICEFIKTFTNVQGIKFRSSLHNTGSNLVLFNQETMKCRNVKKVQISKINIKSRNI